MDDLVSQLQSILGSKEGQDKLKDVVGMLGGADKGFDLSSLGNLFSNSDQNDNQEKSQRQNNNNSNVSGNTGFDFSNIDINMLLKVQQIMSQINNDDKNTQLIKALKPHIKKERAHKIDEAIKIMQLISILPLLRDSGLFGGGDKNV